MVNSAPNSFRRSAIEAMSARLGTFARVSPSSDSNPAAIRGKAAFLAPLIGISPTRGCPPLMRRRSIDIQKPWLVTLRTLSETKLMRASRHQSIYPLFIADKLATM